MSDLFKERIRTSDTLIPNFMVYVIHYFITERPSTTARNEFQILNPHTKIHI